MKKILNYIIAIFAFTIILCDPFTVSAGEIDDGYYIENYHVDIVANDDRTFDITETIDVFFNEERHGIIRDIDLYGAAEELWFQGEIEVIGAPFVDEGNGSIRIGDADTYVEGEQQYIIKYTLGSYAEEDLENDYLYLDVIGTQWNTNINNFSGTITLPEGAIVEDVNLTAGSYGYTNNEIATAELEDNIITISRLRGLYAYEGVTINVKMNEGAYPNAKEYEPAYYIDALDLVANLDENGILKVQENYTITKNNEKNEDYYRYINVTTNSDMQLLNNSEVISDEVFIEKYGEDSESVTFCLNSSDIEIGETVSFTINYEYKIAATDANPVENLCFPVLADNEFEAENINVQINTPVNVHHEPSGILGKGAESEDKCVVKNNDSKHVEIQVKGTDEEVGYFTVNLFFDEEPYVAKMKASEIIFIVIVVVLLILIAVITFFKKDKPLVEVISYYPPKNINPAELGYIIDENCTARDVSSLIYYWAAKGYINIEFTGKNDFVIHKLKEINKSAPNYEKDIFKKFWKIEGKTSKQVSSESLKDSYSIGAEFKDAVDEIKKKYNKKSPIYDDKRYGNVIGYTIGYIIFMVIAMMVAIGFVGVGLYIVTEIAFIIGITITIMSYNGIRKERYSRRIHKLIIMGIWIIIHLILYNGIFIYIAEFQFRSVTANIIFITSTIAVILLQSLYKRTELGNKLLGEALGFKRFLTVAKKEELESLIDENPNYYYDILPYANVLNVSDKWANRFDGINIGKPTYIYSETEMDERELEARIRRNYMHLSASVINRSGFSPSTSSGGSSGGGGGFSGGGFSGGGGGGGGGSSW